MVSIGDDKWMAVAAYCGTNGILCTEYSGCSFKFIIPRRGRTDEQLDEEMRKVKVMMVMHFDPDTKVMYKPVSDEEYTREAGVLLEQYGPMLYKIINGET